MTIPQIALMTAREVFKLGPFSFPVPNDVACDSDLVEAPILMMTCSNGKHCRLWSADLLWT